MNKFLMSVAAAALLASTGAFAQPAQPAPAAAQRAAMMNRTETRADVAANVQRLFARLDTNKDGVITKDEADAMKNRVEANVDKAAERLDSGKIFARLDANHDGKLTQAEADAAMAARYAKAGKTMPAKHGFAGLFARGDTNHDGVIDRAEFDAATNQIKARMEKAGAMRGNFAERLFSTADLNHDGKVTLAEAQQAALQRFDKLDLNHDGKVTPEERQQARQQMRAQHKAAK